MYIQPYPLWIWLYFFVLNVDNLSYDYYKGCDVVYGTRFDEACGSLCDRLQIILMGIPEQYKNEIQEIRIRTEKPIVLTTPKGSFYVSEGSKLMSGMTESLLFAAQNEIDDTVIKICDYSVHSHQHEIKDGFVTLKGGHRAGLCGTAVITGGIITSLRDISSLNIRIANSKENCSREVMEILLSSKGGVILAGPPLCGKTTILRDLAAQLSKKHKVCVVDERSEIAAVYSGIEQSGLGANCDVLNGYPKIIGIVHAVRGLSPKYIIIDEIGTEREAETIKWGLNSGVTFIATIHAGGVKDLTSRRGVMSLLEAGAFENAVFLDSGSNVGQVRGIYNVKSLLKESDLQSENAVCNYHSFIGSGGGIYRKPTP